MKRKRMSDSRFNTLYQNHLSALYLAALCLIGSQPEAEAIAAQAWLETASNDSWAADERLFGLEAARRLYLLAQGVNCTYRKPSLTEALCGAHSACAERLEGMLSQMSLEERTLVTFAVVLGRSTMEIAQILHQSEGTVRRKMHPLTKEFRDESIPLLEQYCA